MEFLKIFGIGLIGYLIFTLGNLQAFNKATPNLTPGQSLKTYWTLNAFYMIGSFLFFFVFTLFIYSGVLKVVFEYLFDEKITNTVDFGNFWVKCFLSFTVGCLNAQVEQLFRKIIKPILVDTRNLPVDEPQSPKP